MTTDQETIYSQKSRRIMVIYGRNLIARVALFDFLRVLDLDPFEWNELIAETGEEAPFIGRILTVGFERAQAAIVLLTPDDDVRLREELWGADDGSDEKQWFGQSMQNVLIEAGMALGHYPDRTIFVQLGQVKLGSDLAGRDIIKLSNEFECRNALVERLKTAGCSVRTTGQDWLRAGDFNLRPVPSTSSRAGFSSKRQSYIVALRFASLVHHNFLLLELHGFGKIKTAVRRLLQEQSKGTLPSLVEDCNNGWLESQEIRKEVERNIYGRNKLVSASDVENVFKVLWTTEPNTARWLASSYALFGTIEDNLDQFQTQLTIVSNCFKQDGNLDIDNIMQFSLATNDLMITTERLLRYADNMIRNLIEALEVDSEPKLADKQVFREHLPAAQALFSQPLSLIARHALRQHSAYFDQLIRERSLDDAGLLLAKDVTTHMLAHAPLVEDSLRREPLRLGVCAPRSTPAGSSFLMNFVAYAPELKDLVTAQLTKQNPQAVTHLDCHRLVWQLGTEVQVQVYGSHLDAEPHQDRFVWNGEKEQLDFEVTVVKEAPVGPTLLKTDVYVEGIRIKRIWLQIDITLKDSGKSVPEVSYADAPVSAFVSYASSDRPRVLDRIASLIIRTGMDIVMDCISLRPSQRWRALIPDLILESDLLLLFWSQDAARSEWVDWEWRHALEHKGISSIEIHPLAPYGLAPLPAELTELHGGDPLMLYREWETAQLKLNQDAAQSQKTENH